MSLRNTANNTKNVPGSGGNAGNGGNTAARKETPVTTTNNKNTRPPIFELDGPRGHKIPVYTEDTKLIARKAKDRNGNLLKDAQGKQKFDAPTKMVKTDLTEWPAFKKWYKTLTDNLVLHQNPTGLKSLTIEAITFFGPGNIGFLKLQADAQDATGGQPPYPGSILLRGASVGMLVVLTPEDDSSRGQAEQYTLLVRQPRLAIGALDFLELPAGMMDASNHFAGTAAKEMAEELHLTIDARRLRNMTEELKALQDAVRTREGGRLEKRDAGVFPSVGGCDEMIQYFLCEMKVTRAQLSAWQGLDTGNLEEGERIKVKVVPLSQMMVHAFQDGKVAVAYGLYHWLQEQEKKKKKTMAPVAGNPVSKAPARTGTPSASRPAPSSHGQTPQNPTQHQGSLVGRSGIPSSGGGPSGPLPRR